MTPASVQRGLRVDDILGRAISLQWTEALALLGATFRHTLVTGVTGDGRTVLDLVISADGRVERVRMRAAPRDVHEFMMLSAAKAWRFDPATVHGRPVRFLLSVAIPRS